MKYLPKNTLAYYLSAPQFRPVDLQHVPSRVVGGNTQKYWDTHKEIDPDLEAVKFYALNQMAAIVRQQFTLHEPLPEWANKVMQTYVATVADQGERLLHYLLLICTREARHATDKGKSTFKTEFGSEFDVLNNFYANLHSDSGGPNSAAADWAKNDLKIGIGKYLRFCSRVFNDLPWGGSYGGKKWGAISETAETFVKGKTTMEMMIDTSWTLAHNGGPMFNKGMLYSHYTPTLYKILDVQHSGQICEMLVDTINPVSISGQSSLYAHLQAVKENVKGSIGDFVDYHKVTAMGIPGKCKSYTSEKANQDKHIPAVPVVETIAGKPVTMKKTWEVLPGQSVQLYDRVKETA